MKLEEETKVYFVYQSVHENESKLFADCIKLLACMTLPNDSFDIEPYRALPEFKAH